MKIDVLCIVAKQTLQDISIFQPEANEHIRKKNFKGLMLCYCKNPKFTFCLWKLITSDWLISFLSNTRKDIFWTSKITNTKLIDLKMF